MTPPCLPVAPQVRTVTLIEVTYAAECRSDGLWHHLWHHHIALYEDDGRLYADRCTLTEDAP